MQQVERKEVGQSHLNSRQLQRGLFMQTFEIDRHSCHHQVHPIRCLCKALVDISKRVSIEPTKRIGRNNTKTNLVGDHDERLVWTQRLRYREQSLTLFQSQFIKKSA